jgi:head-tail adaptor
MIPSGELDQIRSDATKLLQSECEIARRTSESDGGGSFSESWSSYAENVPCRLSALSAGSSTSGGRLSEDAAHRFWIPVSQDVELSDRIIHEGRTWEVTNLPYRSEFDHFLQQVDVKEIDRQD